MMLDTVQSFPFRINWRGLVENAGIPASTWQKIAKELCLPDNILYGDKEILINWLEENAMKDLRNPLIKWLDAGVQ